MIFQTFETLGERNTTEGLHVLFVYANDITGGLFTAMILFAFFIIIAVGSFFSGQRTGQGDFPSSFAIAGYMTFVASVLMLLVPNMVSTIHVGIAFAVAVIGTVWLYMSRSGD